VMDIQSQINHTKSYISFIEEKDKMSQEVIVKELPEVVVATMRQVIPSYDALYQVAPRMGRIMKKQGAVCAKSKYCFNIYHDDEDKKENIDVEICEEVVKALPGGEGVEYKTIQAVSTAACVLHKGPFSTLGSSYSVLFEWVEENGYKVIGKSRESFIDGPWNKSNDEEWLTEIQIPIEK